VGRLGRNLVSNVVGQGLVTVLLLVAGKYLYASMGADAFGVVFFALTLASALSAALDLGLGSTAVREVAANHERDPGYIVGLIRTSSLLCWGVFLTLSSVVLAAAPLLVDRWVRLSELDGDRAAAALRVVAVGGLLTLPRSLYTNVLRGLERMDVSNAIDVGAQAVQQSGTVLLVRAGASLETLVTWLALSQLGWCLAHAAAVARLVGPAAVLPGWDRQAVRRNLRFGTHLTAASILAVIYSQADRLIASHLLPIAVFGSYTFGYSGITRATLLTTAVANAAYPAFAALFAQGDRVRLMDRYQTLQELVCLGTAPLFAAVPFFVRPVATVIFEARVASTLVVPLSLVSLGCYLNGTLTLLYVFSLAAGRPDISVRQNLLTLPVVLPLTALLISRLGLTGAGAAWVLYNLLGYAWGGRRANRECLQLPVRRWLAPLGRAAVLAALTYGPALAWAAGRSPSAAAAAYLVATAAFALGAAALAGPGLRAAVRTVVALRQ
jgi:O-antigen/teichoic acid export membrane protein